MRCGGPNFESPGRGGGRKGPGGSGRSVTGPLPAPHRAPQLGPRTPQLFRSGAAPLQRHQVSTDISRNSLSGSRASCRLMQHSCGSARYLQSCVRRSLPHHFRHRSSKVEYNLAAIPPHLRREESRRKCSGRPGHGRPGRWRRECQPYSPKGPLYGRHTLRRSARSIDVGVVLLFDGQCLFAGTLLPRSTVISRSLPWAVPAQTP